MSSPNYAHVHPEFRTALLLTDEERIEFLDRPRWVGYPLANKVLETLNELLNQPKQPRMRNLLIVGDSNNGKTTLIRRFHGEHMPSSGNEHEGVSCPVVLAEAPPKPDEKGLYASILERLCAPYRPSDTTVNLRYQVIRLLRTLQTRMLIIDEFHSLLTGPMIRQREVMNVLKFLCNELMIPIVGVGTRDALRVLHSDPQHASRFEVLALESWQFNADFIKLLAKFETVLPLKNPSGLNEQEIARNLYAISDGNLGNLRRLLAVCAKAAIKKGTEQITDDIVRAHVRMRPTRGIREI
ncbi:TniB family NTP-binding protein [Sphaerotilus montanus]|uniref:TniB family NTP-binding protein n=1 Tax=Sphaerotilus montanus TaxID=522889 RepID=UPI003FA33220